MTTSIKAYSKIEAGIVALQQQYNHQPDCSTTPGFEKCKKDYRAIRKVETSLEKERKIQGEEARKHVALVNSEAKQIQERLEQISAPFKQARDDRQVDIDKAEADRVSGIKERIQSINYFVNEAQAANSEGVSSIIEAIDLIDFTDNFDEFTAEALKTKQDVLDQLGQILQQKSQAEGAERERLAAEQARAESERRSEVDRRIGNLRMIPLDFMNKPAKEISAKIDSLKGYAIPAEDFGDRYSEAVSAQSQVIEQLGMSLEQAIRLEDAARIQQEQQQRLVDEVSMKQQEPAPDEAICASEFLSDEPLAELPEAAKTVDMASGPDETVISEVTAPVSFAVKTRKESFLDEVYDWAEANRIGSPALSQLETIISGYGIN